MADDSESEQRELAQLWKKARKDGCMSPWQQAKAFGLKEAWQEMHGDKTYGQATWIAERVYVQGRPKCLKQVGKKPTVRKRSRNLHTLCSLCFKPKIGRASQKKEEELSVQVFAPSWPACQSRFLQA